MVYDRKRYNGLTMKGLHDERVREEVDQMEARLASVTDAHTDVRVQLGGVQGLDEFAQALLVAVHLPVSPDEEFPAHVCGVWGRLDLERT